MTRTADYLSGVSTKDFYWFNFLIGGNLDWYFPSNLRKNLSGDR
jgi:hypothetical protein